MDIELIFGVISFTTLILSLAILIISFWKKDSLTSEAAWNILSERMMVLKWGFLLTFFSLVIYLVSESASLIDAQAPSSILKEIHEIGELVHMAMALLVVFIIIPVFKSMLGVRDDS